MGGPSRRPANGFDIDRTVLMQLEGDSGAAMGASVGTGMVGMTTALESLAPDAVVVLGDRGEVRRHTEDFVHGKVFIFSDQEGVVSGSSNLTGAG